MPLGDSLTDGVNYDRAQGELMVSYREELSQELTEYFGRIVFVGAKKTATTTLDETRLLRHAGYSGYVVKQIWAENTYEQTYQHPGIDPFINDLTAKYNPDIVCLLLGHNDNSQINMNKVHTGKSRETLIAEWLVEYEAFVRKIEATMDKNDTIFCSLLTINKDAGTTNNKDEINQSLRPLIEGLMEEGLQVGIADNWSSTQAVGSAGFNAADNTHLNARGYAALAEEWYDVITETYDANGVRRKPEAAAPAAPTLYSKTGISVTLTAVDGYEYKMNDGAWTTDPRFEDLDPNTAYTFYQRVAETETMAASPASAALTVTTNKLDSGVVDPPTVLEKTHNSVTLVANDRYEYKMNDGAWTTNPVFTGLTPETAYTFYQRVRENDIEYAGPTSEGTTVTTDVDPNPQAPLFEEGWQLNAVGWWYQYSDGSYPANGWAFIGESWYYFNAGGYMMTGWVLDGGTWYYLQAGGAMHTGWLCDGGTWYYMNASGAMATGWVLDGSTWYYMNASGAMMTGWVLDGGTWYYMNAGGAMVTGWVLDGGTWYYMNPNGAMATGWILDNGVWYLLSASGAWIG